MPADTQLYGAPDASQQAKIIIAITALQQQAKFLEQIDRAETGWWDKAAMEDAKAAIWNALEQVRTGRL
jgi:hypothetical protein